MSRLLGMLAILVLVRQVSHVCPSQCHRDSVDAYFYSCPQSLRLEVVLRSEFARAFSDCTGRVVNIISVSPWARAREAWSEGGPHTFELEILNKSLLLSQWDSCLLLLPGTVLVWRAASRRIVDDALRVVGAIV